MQAKTMRSTLVSLVILSLSTSVQSHGIKVKIPQAERQSIRSRTEGKINEAILGFFKDRGINFRNDMQLFINNIKSQRPEMGKSLKDFGKDGDFLEELKTIKDEVVEEVIRYYYYRNGKLSDKEIANITKKVPALVDLLERVYKKIKR